MEMTFEVWFEQVNREMIKQVGLDVMDLPDIDYRAEYEAETDPEDLPYLYALEYDDTGLMIEMFE